MHIRYKDVYLKYEDITDAIRPKQSIVEAKLEQYRQLKKEVETMSRKEISNAKSLNA